MLDITIEFNYDFYGNQIYYVGANPHNSTRPTLWVGKDNMLTPVKENRAFTRDYDTAVKLTHLILSGKLREGVPLNLLTIKQEAI